MLDSFANIFVSGLQQLYNLTGDLALAIIFFTLFTRLLLLPLTLKSLRSQKKLQVLQPRIRELQRKYGKDREKMGQETMKLYREEGVNPAGGCLPMVVQLPIFLAVYWAVLELVDRPSIESTTFIYWIPSLGGTDPLYILPILSVVLQFVVQLMATPRVQDPQQRAMTRAMMFMPLFLGYIAFTFPSGAVLYWVTGSIIAIVQQYFTTGFGSLANYLTFLPTEGGFMSKGQPQTEAVSADTTIEHEEAEAAAETRPAGFWDVLGKLATENGQGSSSQEEPSNRAVTAGRGQVGQRPRRKRR